MLGVRTSVVSTTSLTDVHSGAVAAGVVVVGTTAGSLTALNQAREARGIEKKRRKRGSDTRWDVDQDRGHAQFASRC